MVGAGIGVHFGPLGAVIGGAVGFVGDIICMFVCGKFSYLSHT